jgi:hypothetical protein
VEEAPETKALTEETAAEEAKAQVSGSEQTVAEESGKIAGEEEAVGEEQKDQ